MSRRARASRRRKGTWGAFEVAARYHQLSLDEDAFDNFANPNTSAQEAQGATLGVNWYLNRWLKFVRELRAHLVRRRRARRRQPRPEDLVSTRFQLNY